MIKGMAVFVLAFAVSLPLWGEVTRKTMLCKLDKQVEINAYFDSLGYGPNTFLARISDKNTGKVKYYWCSWLLTAEQFDVFEIYLRSRGVLIFDDTAAQHILDAHNARKSNVDDEKE